MSDYKFEFYIVTDDGNVEFDRYFKSENDYDLWREKIEKQALEEFYHRSVDFQ